MNISKKQQGLNLRGSEIIVERAQSGSWAARFALRNGEMNVFLALLLVWAQQGDEDAVKWFNDYRKLGGLDFSLESMPNLRYINEEMGTHFLVEDI